MNYVMEALAMLSSHHVVWETNELRIENVNKETSYPIVKKSGILPFVNTDVNIEAFPIDLHWLLDR